MIMLPAAVRIFLCTRPTDMRKSFDGLTGLVHECFGLDPLTGHLFLFLNRRRDCIKLLYFRPRRPGNLVQEVPGRLPPF
jgi:transposase